MTEPSPGKSKRPRPLVVDVHVPAESHSYPVLIGRGTIARLGTELQQRLGHTGTVALVSDTTVAPLHANNVSANLTAQGFTVVPIVIPAGEAFKTPGTLLEVIGAMIILFDPIFQGLAISLVFGAIVSTLLTLIVVPLIYYMTEKKKWEKPVPAVETTEEPSQPIQS